MDSEQWFSRYPELERMYKLFGYEQLINPLKYQYTSIPSCVQEGPQCGLVALAMIMQNISRDSINGLFEYAKRANYTYNGEMFSVEEMAQLAKVMLNDNELEVFRGDLNCKFIKDFLLDGGFILVPYDSSKNFSPCNENGHKAHWAAVTGCIECVDNTFYVLARQGKSRHIGIWELGVLAQSNMQLEEFSPDRKLDNLEYKLPEGGIMGPKGLKSKAVLVYPKKQS